MIDDITTETARAETVAQILVEVVSASNRLTRVAARLAGGTESPAVWRTLSVLAISGPMRLGELAAESRVSQPTMTKLVHTLVEREWVRRIADTADARAWQIAIAGKGERALEDWRRRLGDAMLPLFSDVSDEEADALARAAAVIHSRVAREISRTPSSTD